MRRLLATLSVLLILPSPASTQGPADQTNRLADGQRVWLDTARAPGRARGSRSPGNGDAARLGSKVDALVDEVETGKAERRKLADTLPRYDERLKILEEKEASPWLRTVQRYLQPLASVAALVGAVAAFVAVLGFFLSRRVARRDATQKVFDRWWGLRDAGGASAAGTPASLQDLRNSFYAYLDKINDAEAKKGLREIDPQVKALTYFFDQLGWLGAADLIDVDYALGPMQHVMRRVWWVTWPNISREREIDEQGGRWLDPVRHFGFEWLYRRSIDRDHPHLLRRTFRKFSRPQNDLLRNIADDEQAFLSKLPREHFRSIVEYHVSIHKPLHDLKGIEARRTFR